MSRLSKLYDAMQTLRNEGLALEDIENQVSQLEEEIIQKEILPIVTESIAPALKDVQRELVLVVDYVPNAPISVHISRKSNITKILDAKRLEIDPEVEHQEYGPRYKRTSNIAPRTGLCIHRKDGSKLQKYNAAQTFIAAIQEAGLMRVRSLDIRRNRINIVSTTIDKKYGGAQHEVSPGLYVLTHSSTIEKKKILDRINAALKMGWNVEIIE